MKIRIDKGGNLNIAHNGYAEEKVECPLSGAVFSPDGQLTIGNCCTCCALFGGVRIRMYADDPNGASVHIIRKCTTTADIWLFGRSDFDPDDLYGDTFIDERE